MIYYINMSKNEKSSFVLGAAILGAAGILCKVIGVLIRIWAYNILHVEGMVYYEAVFPFYSWLLIVSSSGVPTAISRMVSERTARGDWAGARLVLHRSLALLSAIGLVTTAVLFFGAEWFSVHFIGKDATYVLPFRALAPALFFVSVMCAYRGYLQGMQHMTGTGLSQIAEQVVKCAVGLVLARLWIPKGPQYGAAGLLLGVTVSEAMALGVVMAFRFKNRKLYMPRGARKKPKRSRHILSTLMRIAIPITLGASIIPLTGILDVKMIFSLMGKYMDEAAVNQAYVALSSNVRSLINLPASLTTALAMSLVPAISAARSSHDEAGVRRAAGLGLKLSIVIGLPCAAGLFVLGGPVIRMLFRSITSESLAIAARIMRVASLTVVFISLVQTVTGALQGIGRHRVPVYTLLLGGVAKVVSNYFLLSIPSLNILGASISNVICYAVAGILDTVVLLRCTGMKPEPVNTFFKPLYASVLMGASVYLLYNLFSYIHPGSIATLLAVLLGMLLYGALVLILRMFTAEELTYIPGGRRLLASARMRKLVR